LIIPGDRKLASKGSNAFTPSGAAMPSFRYETVDVFTEDRFGGNQLAVFTDARGLSDAQMQSLAAEMNYSETTFVLPPDDPANTARVRIFTRSHEMPFAGHPNVGTAFVLARHGRDTDGLLRFEEIAGLVEVRVSGDADGEVTGATIEAPQPLQTGAELPAEAIAACAGLKPSRYRRDEPPAGARLRRRVLRCGGGQVGGAWQRDAGSQPVPGCAGRPSRAGGPALAVSLCSRWRGHPGPHVRADQRDLGGSGDPETRVIPGVAKRRPGIQEHDIGRCSWIPDRRGYAACPG
jgi:hypothetical protein